MGDDGAKNKMSRPVPHPDTCEDAVSSEALSLANKAAWRSDAKVSGWLKQARLYQESSVHSPPLRALLSFMIRNMRQMPSFFTVETKMAENLTRIASKL